MVALVRSDRPQFRVIASFGGARVQGTSKVYRRFADAQAAVKTAVQQTSAFGRIERVEVERQTPWGWQVVATWSADVVDRILEQSHATDRSAPRPEPKRAGVCPRAGSTPAARALAVESPLAESPIVELPSVPPSHEGTSLQVVAPAEAESASPSAAAQRVERIADELRFDWPTDRASLSALDPCAHEKSERAESRLALVTQDGVSQRPEPVQQRWAWLGTTTVILVAVGALMAFGANGPQVAAQSRSSDLLGQIPPNPFVVDASAALPGATPLLAAFAQDVTPTQADAATNPSPNAAQSSAR